MNAAAMIVQRDEKRERVRELHLADGHHSRRFERAQILGDEIDAHGPELGAHHVANLLRAALAVHEVEHLVRVVGAGAARASEREQRGRRRAVQMLDEVVVAEDDRRAGDGGIARVNGDASIDLNGVSAAPPRSSAPSVR